MIKSKLKIKGSSFWFPYIIELLVVFIGISAGFILNNWREDFIEQKQESKYLKSLYENINSEKEQLDTLIFYSEQKLVKMKSYLQFYFAGTITEDTAKQALIEVLGYSKFYPVTYTYKDMINSGNLTIISDYSLKEEILSYYHFQDEVMLREKVFMEHLNDFCIPLIYETFDVLNFRFTNNQNYKSVKYSNMIAGYYALLEQNVLIYNKLIIKNENILNSLSSKIKE